MAEVGSCFNTTLFPRSRTKSSDLLLPICALNKTDQEISSIGGKISQLFVRSFSFSEKLWYRESMVIVKKSILKILWKYPFRVFLFLLNVEVNYLISTNFATDLLSTGSDSFSKRETCLKNLKINPILDKSSK